MIEVGGKLDTTVAVQGGGRKELSSRNTSEEARAAESTRGDSSQEEQDASTGPSCVVSLIK